MSFFKQLFSSDYRRAVALEGAGRYREAAERYLLAGERTAAGVMHQRHARDCADPWERVDALRKAADFADQPQADALRATLRGELAAALVALVDHAGVMDRRDRSLLQEAADLYTERGEHERAGELLARLGLHNRAADAFKDAGAVNRMEEMFNRQEALDDGKAAADRAWDAYAFARDVGDQVGALEALSRCVELQPHDAGLVARLEDLRRKLPRAGRITLRGPRGAWVLVGGDAVTFGREDTCGLLLLESGVSRLHARLSVERGAPTLEDLGSTHGTFLDGAPLHARAVLQDHGELRLGRSATLRYAFAPHGQLPATLTITSGALKGHGFLWASDLLTTGIPPAEPEWVAPGLKLAFLRGYWHVVPEESEGAVLLARQPCARTTLLQLGDTLDFEGMSVRVE